MRRAVSNCVSPEVYFGTGRDLPGASHGHGPIMPPIDPTEAAEQSVKALVLSASADSN